MEPLAHSARLKFGISEQRYYDHVDSVIYNSTISVKKMIEYKEEDSSSFLETVRHAACLHDLGKLDEKNQKILQMGNKQRLPVNHVDAGTARLVELNHLECIPYNPKLINSMRKAGNKKIANSSLSLVESRPRCRQN